MNKVLQFLQNNSKFLLLGLIALVIFNKFIVLIALIIILGIIGILSLQVTRMVPHISVETITASSILLGYVWGWKIGLSFGLFIGMYGIYKISFIKLKSIVNVLLMGLCGVIAAIFAILHYNFTWTYMLTFIIRIILNNLIFPLIEADWTENMIHGFGDPIFNMLVTFQIINLIYFILVAIKVPGGM